VGIRTVLANGAVDVSLNLGSIPDERGKWICDLVEQGPDLRAIFDIMGRQL
jgi:hypothetical protein